MPFAPGETWERGQEYGFDETYEGNTRHFHEGVDFLMPLGVMFCAVDAGVVVIAAANQPVGFPLAADGAWGNYVEIDHGNGLHSGYCHLGALLVWPGQKVRRGQAVGPVGMTGLTFGPHGHLQALLNGKRVDPTPLIS